MSFSSSVGSGRRSYTSGSRITWQVEHAHERSHAPTIAGRQEEIAAVSTLAAVDSERKGSGRTLEVDVMLVGDGQDVVALVGLDRPDHPT